MREVDFLLFRNALDALIVITHVTAIYVPARDYKEIMKKLNERYGDQSPGNYMGVEIIPIDQ